MIGPSSALVVRAWELFDSHQLRRLDEVFAPGATFGSEPTIVIGSAAIADVVAGHYRAFPETTHLLVRCLEDETSACVEGRVCAVHAGTLDSPVGPIAATGRRLEWTATVWIEVAAGRISSWTTVYDRLGILSDLDAW